MMTLKKIVSFASVHQETFPYAQLNGYSSERF